MGKHHERWCKSFGIFDVVYFVVHLLYLLYNYRSLHPALDKVGNYYKIIDLLVQSTYTIVNKHIQKPTNLRQKFHMKNQKDKDESEI